MAGIDFISVVVGLFAIPEILANLEAAAAKVYQTRLAGIYPTLQDWRRCIGAFIRGTLIGFFVGILPGNGLAIASFIAYDVEKKSSRQPEKFGTGMIEGVAVSEGANNAAAGGGLVPLLTLGIPASSSSAVLLGALMIHGLQPGPLLFTENPAFVWALIASMYVGNVMLLVLNLPLIGLWAKLCEVPYPILTPIVLVVCVLGTYSIRYNLFDVWAMIVFGVLGYFMRKLAFPAAPLMLALILTPMLESALGQSLTISDGSFLIFVTRPMSLALVLLAAVSLAAGMWSRRRADRAGTPLETRDVRRDGTGSDARAA